MTPARGIPRRTVLKAAGASAAFASLDFTSDAAAASPGTGVSVDLGIDSTTTEYTINPLGLDLRQPRLSWQTQSSGRNRAQSAYQLLISRAPERLREGAADVWDSGKVVSDQSVLVPYGGPELQPRTRYYWTVRIWDTEGNPSEWSAPAWWETGLLDPSNWAASWIGHAGEPGTTQLRREFQLDKPIVSARLYATALGVYESEINGRPVGTDRLAPGWTDYRTRVQYQTYDVTNLLSQGGNAIGVRLGPGWYAGHVGMFGEHQYGERPLVLTQLEITHTDGTTSVVSSDDQWRSAVGPIKASDLLMGEIYDARAETPGWSGPGFDAVDWRSVHVASDVDITPVAQADPPVRMTEELAPIEMTEPRPGVFVYDLGQNMVGTVRIALRADSGTSVRLRHAEVLNPDGTIYTENLRTAKATDTYVAAGRDEEVYEPRFTFHGFRYVEVTGLPRPPAVVVGRVLHTDAPRTMSFTTDDPLLNKLHTNITWGQRGNFLSIPTDTPARDERLGWTGDINVFAGTAAYTMQSARFLSKWMTDLRDAQQPEGAFTDVAPAVGDLPAGNAGWGDAGVTVPWILYERYGDRRTLEENYPAMREWISFLEQDSPDHVRPASGSTYGDWLNVEQETRRDLIATAWFGYSAREVARVADALGRNADARAYESLFDKIRTAFQQAFVTADGRLRNHAEQGLGDTQTGYVLALSIDLLPEQLRTPAADRLVKLIEDRDWHLATGFLGTPKLLPILTETGHIDVAYRLVRQRTYPSWGYQIDRGSTTMWERWNSIRPDGGFADASMNSFNHYAYGSVGEWMYQNIAGIIPGQPGFGHIVIRPRPGGGIQRAEASYASEYGEIGSRWRIEDSGLTLEVTVPFNTTAEVWVPGTAVSVDPSARVLREAEGCVVYGVGSGDWVFHARQG